MENCFICMAYPVCREQKGNDRCDEFMKRMRDWVPRKWVEKIKLEYKENDWSRFGKGGQNDKRTRSKDPTDGR